MADPYGYPRPIVVDLTESINEFRRKVNQIGDDLGDKLRLGTDFGTSFRTDSDLVGALIELDYRVNEFDSDLYLRIDGGSLFLENGTTDTLHAELTYDSASGLFQINAPRGDMTLEALSSIILDAQGGNWFFKDQTVTQMQIIGGTNKEIDVPSGNLTLDVDGDIILDADGNDIQFSNGAGGDTVTHTLADDATYTIAAPADYIVDAVGDIDLDAGDLIVRFKANGTTHLTHTLGPTNFINSAQDLVRNISGALTDSATSSILRVAGTTVTDTVGTDYALTAGGNYTVDIDGNYTVDVDGSIKDSAGTTYTVVAGTNISQTATTGSIQLTSGTTLNQNAGSSITQTSTTTYDIVSGGNLTATVTGNTLIDGSGTITLDADAGNVYIDDAGTTQFEFVAGTNKEIDVPSGNLTLDVAGDIILDAGDSDVFINLNGATQFQFTSGTNKEIDIPSGDLTVDVAGDITLDADNGNVIIADATTTQFQFIAGADKEIDVPSGNLTVDVASDITLDADGGNVILHDGGVEFAQFSQHSTNDVIIKSGGTTTMTLDSDNVTFANNAYWSDDNLAIFGDGEDLKIFHQSSTTTNFIQSFTASDLNIEANGNVNVTTNNNETMATFTKNGAVTLFHNDSARFNTTSTGINITGDISSDLLPSADNTFDIGASGTEWRHLYIDGTANIDELAADSATISIAEVANLTVTSLLTAPLISPTTVSFNDYVSGTNSNIITFGDDSDMIMYHDGSHSRIRDKGTGDLFIQANNLRLTNGDATLTYAQGINGGAIDLRHNNNVKLVTTSTGVTITGLTTTDTLTVNTSVTSSLIPTTGNTYDLGSNGAQWRDLYIDGTANIDSLVADTADINAGTIDGATIGGASAAAGTFTTMAATNATVNGTLDPNIITANIISFGDGNDSTSNVITMGADSDMLIYHNGSHSYVRDVGTGELRLNGNVVALRSSGDGEVMLTGTENGAVVIYHDNAQKLTTTTGGVTVTGLLTADTKSFTIDHPTKEGMKLRYGSLEGPEHAVYVRGRLNGEDTIELPDHWTGLVDEDTITVNLTPIGKGECWVEDIQDNKVTVGGHLNCFYMVLAERKDVDKLEVEFPADGD